MLCIGKASVSAHAEGVAGLFKFKLNMHSAKMHNNTTEITH